ncbi:MAG: hypothetical protein Q9226_008063 [Calogaya cf. arnoldii]
MLPNRNPVFSPPKSAKPPIGLNVIPKMRQLTPMFAYYRAETASSRFFFLSRNKPLPSPSQDHSPNQVTRASMTAAATAPKSSKIPESSIWERICLFIFIIILHFAFIAVLPGVIWGLVFVSYHAIYPAKIKLVRLHEADWFACLIVICLTNFWFAIHWFIPRALNYLKNLEEQHLNGDKILRVQAILGLAQSETDKLRVPTPRNITAGRTSRTARKSKTKSIYVLRTWVVVFLAALHLAMFLGVPLTIEYLMFHSNFAVFQVKAENHVDRQLCALMILFVNAYLTISWFTPVILNCLNFLMERERRKNINQAKVSKIHAKVSLVESETR